MENSLWELLCNGQTAEQIVVILFEVELTDSQLACHLIQLLVNCCGLDYIITEEVASNIYEQKQLAADLDFMPRNDQENGILERQNVDMRGFLVKLFNAIKTTALVQGEWFKNSYNFLRLILENDDVPEDSVLKVSCAYLNSLFLIPLSNIYIYLKRNEEAADFVETLRSLSQVIRQVFLHIQKGFRYEIICDQVSQEFFHGMEKFSDLYVSRLNYLSKYEKLLENHNELINTNALISLQKLCNNESNHEQLEAFFISASCKKMLQDLVRYRKRKLTLEISELLINLKNFMDDDILPPDVTDLLLLDVFSPVSKQSRQAAKMIISLNRDLWQTIVDLFVRYENDITKLERLIDNSFKWNEVAVDVHLIIGLIEKNLEDVHKACTAAQIFVLILKKLKNEDPDSDIVLDAIQEYPELIPRIDSVQEAVAVCLTFFLDLKSEDLQNVTFDAISAMLKELANCATNFDSYWPLRRVISGISKLYLQFGDVENILYSMTKKLLRNFEDVANSLIQGIPQDIVPLTLRLMIFLEQPFTTLIDEVCLTRLFALVQTFIEENDNWEPKEISILLGLNTSIFKQFWLKFNNGETVEIDTVELTSALIRHVDRLFFKMEELNLDFLDGMIIFKSAMELLIYFQPHIFFVIPNPVFKTALYSLNKPKIVTMVNFLETYLFKKLIDPETDRGLTEKRTMFDMWLYFNKSYIDFPSKTASSHIIRYYGIDKRFTYELENLIEILQTLQPRAFTQTVARTVILFSIDDEFEGFKKYWQSLVNLIIAKHDKNLAAVGANIMLIAECIMRQLQVHINNCANHRNRLAILDYIVYFLKDYNINNRARLITDAFKDLGKRNDLFAIERTSIENFKEKMTGR